MQAHKFIHLGCLFRKATESVDELTRRVSDTLFL
jgi:hypothetical protein